ncbi:MAG: hypothetical protein PHD95_01475 [Candidatus ainarchaeum sp.]|nr:hypothetical protein [Candidatus ainarchaeum sp.]
MEKSRLNKEEQGKKLVEFEYRMMQILDNVGTEMRYNQYMDVYDKLTETAFEVFGKEDEFAWQRVENTINTYLLVRMFCTEKLLLDITDNLSQKINTINSQLSENKKSVAKKKKQ